MRAELYEANSVHYIQLAVGGGSENSLAAGCSHCQQVHFSLDGLTALYFRQRFQL